MLDSLEIRSSFYLLNKMILDKTFCETEAAIMLSCKLIIGKVGVEGYDSE